MRCPAFESLIKDMKKNEIDKEHYSFVYNGFQFDTIYLLLQAVMKSLSQFIHIIGDVF